MRTQLRLAQLLTFVIAVMALPLCVSAQGPGTGTGTGTGGDGFPVNQPQTPAPVATPTPVLPTPETSSQFQPGEFDLGETLQLFNIEPPEVEIENLRIQPFVGRSIEAYQTQELVHPRSLLDPTGTGGASGRSIGGATQFGGRGAGAGQATAQQNGFEVARRGLRTRINPQIVVNNRMTPAQHSTEMRQRLARIPAVAELAANINVSIQGTTAVLTGTVATEDERERIIRMTRLEPGIFRIDDQITIAN